jgi:hypothetical protein
MQKEKQLTEKDYMVMEYLHELSRTNRLKLLFIFEDMRNNIIQDECLDLAENLIKKVQEKRSKR